MPENGGKNAGLLAARILALSDANLAKRYQDFVKAQHDAVLAADAELQD
jgi:5-(carboxyamino)imidazole ribonucleotide mutase